MRMVRELSNRLDADLSRVNENTAEPRLIKIATKTINISNLRNVCIARILHEGA